MLVTTVDIRRHDSGAMTPHAGDSTDELRGEAGEDSSCSVVGIEVKEEGT